METLRARTENTTNNLRALGYTVVEKWEHIFLKEKKDMKQFLATHEIEERLNPRDAFFGGRTNAVKLYYEGKAKYVDFTSLYPWVSSMKHYQNILFYFLFNVYIYFYLLFT